jgi:tetratricopeptide (TPR) repeat protein
VVDISPDVNIPHGNNALADGIRRRNFLIRCCQGLSAALVSGRLRCLSAPLVHREAEFHLHPHYRAQTPLDAVFLKAKAGSDTFVTEKYHDQIAAILAEWSASLLQSPQGIQVVEKSLAPGFSGSSLALAQSKLVRPGRKLEVHRLTFEQNTSLRSAAFLEELRSALGSFSKILTAEFQVTRIDANSSRIQTRVRYELVGTGQDFYREQRAGFWELEWETAPSSEYRLRSWRAKDETRSRSREPFYADITSHAFASNASYSAQMLRGADYWRTVLDGACGIDIYGHNGVSAGDIDNDGFDDLYVCQPAGLPNRLYRNRGDGTFEDITEASGVGILENTACALFADFNNNGNQDLLVVRANGPLLFLNEGGGKFRLKPDAFHFASPPQGTFTGAAAADYDRDGFLDVYFCLYVYYQGTDQYKYPTPYYDAQIGPPNFLMRNNGDGTFRDVTAQSGLDQNNNRYSFCCGWSDYNRDGWPGLYVVNDFGRKNLYRNNGNGTFTDVASQAGVEDVGAGMSVSWLDYDNDGADDLYSADMWTAAGERISTQQIFQKAAPQQVRALYRKHAMGNSLFRNSGKGAFEDATELAEVGMGRWSWSSDSWDFDHDGFPDLYVANGMLSGPLREDLNSFFWRQVVANSPNQAKASPDYEQAWNAINELIRSDYSWSGFERNVFYANNRDGTFSDVSGAVGLDFIEDGRAFALADFDHDGRQEVLLKNRNAPQLRLMKNVMADLPSAIAFHLRGTKSNRDAIGAAVTVETELGGQTRMLQAGSGFLSQHSKEMFFGLGDAKGPVKLSIRWPSGLVQQLNGLPQDHRIWIEEGAEPSRMEPFQRVRHHSAPSKPQESESFPETIETWLLAPIPAPRAHGPQLLTISADNAKGEDFVAIYNLLYRYLFDRHRDLTLPTSFLIDEHGDIVKVYQGPVNPKNVEKDFQRIPGTNAERVSKALPFRGVTDMFEFRRNYLSYGSVYFDRGYLDQAEASFRLALRDDASSAEAYYGLGSVYLKQERTSEALDNFKRTVKLEASYPSTLPNAWNNLGLIAARDGRTDEAIGCFENALRLSPDHFIALENLGNAYRQQKRWDEARTALERALSVKPEDPEANYGLAMVFAQTEETARAYEYLQKALKFRPSYPEALNNLGVLYLRTNRRDEAVVSFKECIRVVPSFDQAYLNLARVYTLEDKPDKARTVLRELLQQHPGHLQAQKALDELR